ncbi:MAG TPA: hypothetical protein VI078_17860 [bacterium]
MRRVCAWCRRELGRAGSAADDAPITHGICGDCARREFSPRTLPLRQFLDRFAEPVFIVNAATRVVTGNATALALLGKTPSEIEDRLGGDALGCRHAELPGGCGNTLHCRTCTIRLTVRSTLDSGQPHVRVAAYPDLPALSGGRRVRFLITTERMGDVVLLRVDEVADEGPALPAADDDEEDGPTC